MLKIAKEVLSKIEEHNFEAFIVGGFSRDVILNIKSTDIDITTNASPMELSLIFKDAILPTEKYGFVSLLYKNILFEITTYRKEIYYEDRKPVKLEYIDDIDIDLNRRDFTINAICIDKDGEFYDPLNGRDDLNKRIIKSINEPNIKFVEDPLRMLRAIRFATNLDFNIEEDTYNAIYNNKHLLKEISYFRKKEELNKIFTSISAKKGIDLLLELELDTELELEDLNKITDFSSGLSIWSVLNVVDKYPFTKYEKDIIRKVNLLMKEDLYDPYTSFRYGFYSTRIAASIKGMPNEDIIKIHKNLKIRSKKDIKLNGKEIIKLIKCDESRSIKKIYDDLINLIVNNELNNTKKDITKYINDNVDLYTCLK